MSRTILGVLSKNHDPTAVLFDDGDLVAIGEQERFSRNKHAYKEFPAEAIEFCLEAGDVEFEDVDCIAYGWDASKYPLYMARKFLDGWAKFDKDQRTLEWEKSKLEENCAETVREKFVSRLDGVSEADLPPFEFYEHHRAHAASASYSAGTDSAAVLTADGHGEEHAVVGWHATEDGLEQVFAKEIPESLGWFYSSITAYLGFRAQNGEGKVMGMAPYGDRAPEVERVLSRVLTIEEGDYEIDPSYIFYGDHSHHERYTDKLVEELGEPRERGEEITDRYENVAHVTQRLTEEALEQVSQRLLRETGEDSLCLAGGVAYNCKANMHLRESLDLESFFVQPLSGEPGVPLGSCQLASGATPGGERLRHVYYGYEASEDRIESAVEEAAVTVEASDYDGTRERMVEELLKGAIVARYDGRTETGPRALGNRSILADPRDARMLDEVNEVKRRANWRPFAPTLLAGYADEVLHGEPEDPFMIQTYQVRDEWQDRIEAAVHVDGSTRPQILRKSANEGYWRLIDSFRQETGTPALLNTSFNLSGDPIVNTPEQAINTLERSALDYLQVGPYLVSD